VINSSDPNQPVQNYEIVNPTLEQQVANLLPSVAGYGGNLRSTNTIIPIVDLTTAAEGSTLPETLNNAWDFASDHNTVNNTTTTLISNTGFWRVLINYREENVVNNTVTPLGRVFMDDGASTKTIWQFTSTNTSSATETIGASVTDFYVFLNSGQELKATSVSTRVSLDITTRQVASKDGTITQPLNFS
tara:strand:+ start:475 stop:1041 length:567 start_codon:yes stop_codon:yes gene_type:complete